LHSTKFRNMTKRVMLFTLHTFSTTGGLQKMTRTLAYSLQRTCKVNNWQFRLWSVYDSNRDLAPQYISEKNFRGFGTNKLKFLLSVLKTITWPDIIIISHINLSVIGLLIKLANPKCKIWLIAHGIEVWRPLSPVKKLFLKKCDKVLCVSDFTRQEIIRWHDVNVNICDVLNNTVDPFMKLPVNFNKPQHLLNKHQLLSSHPIIFTLTRLASTEQYKGHEQVIKVIGKLKSRFPSIKYILAGQSDPLEKIRILKLIEDNKVEKQVILTGFLDELELPDYFLLADLFVLPSKKEGFGIVFIEALACGLPVICGDSDGSIDAIRDGELGTAIKADNLDELEDAIIKNIEIPLTEDKRQHLQQQCLFYFNENDYAGRLEKMIINE